MQPITIFFFFFNDTATTEIYTLSLHDALPIYSLKCVGSLYHTRLCGIALHVLYLKIIGKCGNHAVDRKSTRLNSSHANISYAVFCLKKKKNTRLIITAVQICHAADYYSTSLLS